MSGQNISAKAGVRSVSFEAVIQRADGTVEDLGQIAYWDKNPLRRLAWRVSRLLRRA
jgi:hypothetical protein